MIPAAPWPPDFDLHEEEGEMVVHAEGDGLAEGEVEVTLDGDVLVVRDNGLDAGHCRAARLPLPFAPRGFRRVSRPRRHGLEVRLRIPEERSL